MHPLIPWTPEPAPVTTARADHRRRARPDLPARSDPARSRPGSARRARRSTTHWQPGRARDRPGRNRCHRGVPALDARAEARSDRHGHRPATTSRSRRAASKGRYVYRVGDDEAEMTFCKAGDAAGHHRPHRGAGRLPRPGRRRGAGGARRRRRPRGGQEDHCRSARSRRRSSAAIPSGRTCCGSGGRSRHELEPDARPDLPDRRRGRRDRDADHPARPRPRRLRGAPGAAGAEAADGRAVHLLRPDGAGGVPDRPGRRRAAASAYRARHRHLSLPAASSSTATASGPTR